MKQLITYLLLTGLILGLAGCRLNYMEPEEMQDFLDGVVENIGDSQITDDEDLIGTRTLADSDDSYAGAYTAECESVTGRDVILAEHQSIIEICFYPVILKQNPVRPRFVSA